MNSETTESRTTGSQQKTTWKWVIGILGGLVLLSCTCVLSSLWGGFLGYAIGRGTGPRMTVPPAPYESPYRPVPPMPDIPDGPNMPELAERPWLGVGFVITDEGALITEVVSGSPADESGLRNDDVIAEVDGRPVTEARPLDELILRYAPGDRVELTVLRQGRERMVRVRLASWLEGGMPYWEDRFEMPVEPRWEG
jgi:membrane-associated protease RseP (regulator of RpoE activity)